MENKNPIDEKVDKVTEVITTSRSVYKALIFIWYLALVVGIGFIIAAPIIYNIEHQSSDGVVYGFYVSLPVGFVIVIVSLLLISSTKKKLKTLTN